MRKTALSCHLFFGTLGSKLKKDILLSLRGRPMFVSELATELGEERSKVSHALILLRRCHFVESKKAGKRQIYSLNKDTAVPILKLAEVHVKKYCRNCKHD